MSPVFVACTVSPLILPLPPRTSLTTSDIAQRTGAGKDVVRGYLAEALEIYEREGSPAAEELRGRLEELGDPDSDADC